MESEWNIDLSDEEVVTVKLNGEGHEVCAVWIRFSMVYFSFSMLYFVSLYFNSFVYAVFRLSMLYFVCLYCISFLFAVFQL